jgi:hypothetical protein
MDRCNERLERHGSVFAGMSAWGFVSALTTVKKGGRPMANRKPTVTYEWALKVRYRQLRERYQILSRRLHLRQRQAYLSLLQFFGPHCGYCGRRMEPSSTAQTWRCQSHDVSFCSWRCEHGHWVDRHPTKARKKAS